MIKSERKKLFMPFIVLFSLLLAFIVVIGSITPTRVSAYTETGYFKPNSIMRVSYNSVDGYYEITGSQKAILGNGVSFNKSVEDVDGFEFSINMTGLGATNKYFPVISIDTNSCSYYVQFCCYNTTLVLKCNYSSTQTNLLSLEYSNGEFDGRFGFYPVDNGLQVKLNGEDLYLIDYSTFGITGDIITDLTFGLQTDSTSIVPDWKFYDMDLFYDDAPTLSEETTEVVDSEPIELNFSAFRKVLAIVSGVSLVFVILTLVVRFIYLKKK